jgi:hypothetical protein
MQNAQASFGRHQKICLTIQQPAEIQWSGFEGRFEEPGTAVVTFANLNGGVLRGGGTAAINGGVISAGFDAALVLAQVGRNMTLKAAAQGPLW